MKKIGKKGSMRFAAAAVGGVMLAGMLGGFAPESASAEATDVDFARALQYSIYFYDANMCGTDVLENNRYDWRGNCHTYDAEVPLDSTHTNLSESFITQYKAILDSDGDGCVNVEGGFHDAGDHVKFGMPENYAASTLGWGYYEFRDSYVKLGQDSHIETILRYFNDYLMRCTFRDENGEVIAHCYQVGDGDIDHAYWNSPEIDDMDRPAFFLTGDKPQTDYVVSAAASLAVNYLNFKDTDPDYAAKSLDYAKALFSFAQNHEKQLSDNADGPKGYYRSEKWQDDYVWAAAWLYIATEDKSYLTDAMPYVDYYAPSGWAYCWNDVWSGALTLLGEIDLAHPELDLQNMYRTVQGKTQYEDADFWLQIEKAIDKWMTAYTTPGGYAFLNQWGSARYNTAMQYVTLVYDKYKNNNKPSAYSDWAKGQMEYLMGDNPMDRCYIVGYNEKSAQYPHHRAASGLTKCEDTGKHRYVLYGALVGGPDGQDKHVDTTADYIYNEVTIDYNAAFVGACAGLYAYYGTDDMHVTPDFPPKTGGADQGGNDFWVDAYAVDDLRKTGEGVTKITALMRTDSVKPKTDLSMRYFFSIAEMENKSNLSTLNISELYDQASTEAAPADGVLSGPYQYDASYDPDIYYVEVKWDGYKIANSNKKYQFAIGLYYGDNWDPSNDWSYEGIAKATDTYQDGSEKRNDHICVYSDGVLVGGVEPNGKKPEQTEETTTTTTPTTTTAQMTTTTTTSASTVSTEETTDSSGETTQTTATTTTATTTATSGNGETTETPADVLYGDVNLDGDVDLADAVLLNKAVAGAVELSDLQKLCADCKYDQVTDANDSMELLRFLVHLTNRLGPNA